MLLNLFRALLILLSAVPASYFEEAKSMVDNVRFMLVDSRLSFELKLASIAFVPFE